MGTERYSARSIDAGRARAAARAGRSESAARVRHAVTADAPIAGQGTSTLTTTPSELRTLHTPASDDA
jgi:hypothetical protein